MGQLPMPVRTTQRQCANHCSDNSRSDNSRSNTSRFDNSRTDSHSNNQRCSIRQRLEQPCHNPAELLATLSGLSKARIKDAMQKGAVSVTRGRTTRRLRRTNTHLRAGELLQFNYDARLLALAPPAITCLLDQQQYSVWIKPAGLMSQGNEYGDHLAMTRLVERYFAGQRLAGQHSTGRHSTGQRPVFLVHRLDRETHGLLLLAHSKACAAAFGRQLQQHQIQKSYQAIVRGQIAEHGQIDQPLDGKSALTHYRRLHYDPQQNTSQVAIELHTGRTHQIRRHFAAIGHPLMGDPRYGSANKNRTGLQLVACALTFICPLTQQRQQVQLPEPYFNQQPPAKSANP